MISAQEALDRLRNGNRRFVSGFANKSSRHNNYRRTITAEGQNPFAIILGCSDSRVPAEIVFDQGLGDLFVIRVVGNIVAPSQIGSVEFATSSFGTRLVVVLGHSQCGAILAALDHAREQPEQEHSENSRSIFDRITPAIQPLLHSELAGNSEALVESAVRANIQASVASLRHESKFLEQKIDDAELQIVGAEYSLKTGAVEFFSGQFDE